MPDRKRGPGAHGAGQEIDLADLKKLLGFLDCDGRIGLFVFEQKLDWASHDSASRIDLPCRKLESPAHLLADAGIGAAKRGDDANLDGVGGLAGGGRGDHQRRAERGFLHCYHCILLGVLCDPTPA